MASEKVLIERLSIVLGKTFIFSKSIYTNTDPPLLVKCDVMLLLKSHAIDIMSYHMVHQMSQNIVYNGTFNVVSHQVM